MAKDYRPFLMLKEENIRIVKDDEEEEKEPPQVLRSIVNDRTFERLKIKEDKLNAEIATREFNLGFQKKQKMPSDNESGDENQEHFRSKTLKKGRAEDEVSNISHIEESEEELITEEMFQKALQATLQKGMIR